MRDCLAQGPSHACHFGDLLSLSMCWPSLLPHSWPYLPLPITSHASKMPGPEWMTPQPPG